ncbi:hypothetical protein N6H05_24610 [Sphingobium sp. WTD-1]|jgi:hypothetical protein|uniref:hypothetical protein n=1 Tax=Sphingobium sp. WTD-1 TaxID=2979467 RepID=UPI0024DE849B|nr:hypothetical protein [Sphingobium sp. WTD-1]WIA56157.1 hypothetical protein N6H05_24610 [Sphingobium sp. WTD-1]
MLHTEIISELLDDHSTLLVQTGRTPIDMKYQQIRQWSADANISEVELTERLALDVAARYAQREIDYGPADWIINNLFLAMTDDPLSNWSDLFFDIYNAFDSGEYRRDGDGDVEPSEKYTRPEIARILSMKR